HGSSLLWVTRLDQLEAPNFIVCFDLQAGGLNAYRWIIQVSQIFRILKIYRREQLDQAALPCPPGQLHSIIGQPPPRVERCAYDGDLLPAQKRFQPRQRRDRINVIDSS